MKEKLKAYLQATKILAEAVTIEKHTFRQALELVLLFFGAMIADSLKEIFNHLEKSQS